MYLILFAIMEEARVLWPMGLLLFLYAHSPRGKYDVCSVFQNASVKQRLPGTLKTPCLIFVNGCEDLCLLDGRINHRLRSRKG